MTDEELEVWKSRIEIVHRKEGRTLTTVIVHVSGDIEPPLDILLRAAGNWSQLPLGQAVRRPDENGRQVYWVNAVN